MKRFTLIIDGHNFFFRSLWSAFRQGHKNKILTSQKDVDTFEKKLMLDFCSVVKMMNPIVNDIVFVKELFDGLPRYISSASIMASVFLALHSGVERQKLHDFVTLLGASVAKNEVDGVVILFQNKVFSEYFTKTKKQRNNYSWEIKRCENIIYHYCNGNVLNTIPSVQNYRYPLIRFDLD